MPIEKLNYGIQNSFYKTKMLMAPENVESKIWTNLANENFEIWNWGWLMFEIHFYILHTILTMSHQSQSYEQHNVRNALLFTP